MKGACEASSRTDTFLAYWAGELPEHEAAALEDHLFGCAECADHATSIVALGETITALARQGRLSGIISRAILNRLARDGVRVRFYSLASGEAVPCAVWPDDDVVVAALRGDFGGIQGVSLSLTGPDNVLMDRLDDVPLSPDGELLYATPGSIIRQLPSMRLCLTVSDGGPNRGVLGEYVLAHTATRSPRPEVDGGE